MADGVSERKSVNGSVFGSIEALQLALADDRDGLAHPPPIEDDLPPHIASSGPTEPFTKSESLNGARLLSVRT